jgi:hypothetical protein
MALQNWGERDGSQEWRAAQFAKACDATLVARKIVEAMREEDALDRAIAAMADDAVDPLRAVGLITVTCDGCWEAIPLDQIVAIPGVGRLRVCHKCEPEARRFTQWDESVQHDRK